MTQHYDINWLKSKYRQVDSLDFIFFYSHRDKLGEGIGKFCLSQWYPSPFSTYFHALSNRKKVIYKLSNPGRNNLYRLFE